MTTPTGQPNNDQTMNYLRQLAEARFWGAVTVKFENGEAVHIRREESILPSKLNPKDNPGKQHVTNSNL